MDTPHPATAQQAWRAAVVDYAQAVNRYVAQGTQEGWDGLEEPQSAPTEHLLPAWLAALQAVNRPGVDALQHQAFRQDWPPAHLPLIPMLDQQAQSIGTLVLLDDGRLLARIGTAYQPGQVVQIDGESVTPVAGVDHFGRCPARRYFALGNADGVRVTDGWGGQQVAQFAWPNGLEGLPADAGLEALEHPPQPTALIPFPDGQRVLLVSSDGIFVLHGTGATRLLRRAEDILQDMADGISADDLNLSLSMEHAAISADGSLIAIGEQCGQHLVLNDRLEVIADIGPAGEYPHFALFNQRGDRLILNACHFYYGATLGVAVKDIPGLKTDFYSDDPRTPVLQDGARVYAGASRNDEFIVGDAYGYLRAFGEDGQERWQHFIGSTISAMDISPDGKTLVVASHAGFISVIALDTSRPDWQIGTGEHAEVHRWLFWKQLDRPLRW
ncbi:MULTISPECIES: hypothetical protein [Pseudomonas]|uniref:Uncharacterized protein n=1 Tax=Pseudomonas fluorescens TaxID=294 RepID=A0A5E6UK69_PSEFL|nr:MULTISPECIES: hypothetical protein [Pseudomonas]VVN05553.1 hypothetical protein PS652_03533 [Pseudomonas fluorescens]